MIHIIAKPYSDTKDTIVLILFGMWLGSLIAISLKFAPTVLLWGIGIVIVGGVFLFLKFFKGYEQAGTFGYYSMILISLGITIGGLIATYIGGGT